MRALGQPDRSGGAMPALTLTLALTLALAVAGGRPTKAQPPPGASPGDALTAALTRGDVEMFRTDLQLTATQAGAVDDLFATYGTSLAEGARAVRESMGAIRIGPPEIDGERRKRLEQLRDEMSRLREDAQRRAEAQSDPSARRAIWQEYADRVRELYRAEQDDTERGAVTERYQDAVERAQQTRRVWESRKEQLTRDFLAGVQGLLDEPQQERWPHVERKLRREKTMRLGRLSGESIDLFLLVREAADEADPPEGLAPLLEAYGVRLDVGLRARNDALAALRLARDSGADPAAVTAATGRLVQARAALREINEEFVPLLAAELGPELGPDLQEKYNRRAYPQIYGMTAARRLLRSAGGLPDLDAETQAIIAELEASYEARVGPLNEMLRATIRREEPAELRASLERRAAGATRSEVAAGRTAFDAALDARRTVDDEVIAQLKVILTPRQLERLPNARRRSSGAGDPDSPNTLERRDWVMEQFDRDGNGRLDETEQDALREFLRKRQSGDR